MTAETDAADLINWLLKHTQMTQKDIAHLAKTSQGTVSKWRSGTHDPGAAEYQRLTALVLKLKKQPPEESDDLTMVRSASVVHGRRLTTNLNEGVVPEFEHHGGAGGGGYPLPTQISDGVRTYSSEVVSDAWTMPVRFLRDELRVNLNDIDIIKIRGDSMETADYGGFRDGDRVVIDRGDKSVRQGAIFAVREDDDVIVKQVTVVRGSEPMRIICASLNKNYAPFELVLNGAAEIIGRVVLKISRT